MVSFHGEQTHPVLLWCHDCLQTNFATNASIDFSILESSVRSNSSKQLIYRKKRWKNGTTVPHWTDRHTHTYTHRPCLPPHTLTPSMSDAKSSESLSSANCCQTTPTTKHVQDHTHTHTHSNTLLLWLKCVVCICVQTHTHFGVSLLMWCQFMVEKQNNKNTVPSHHFWLDIVDEHKEATNWWFDLRTSFCVHLLFACWCCPTFLYKIMIVFCWVGVQSPLRLSRWHCPSWAILGLCGLCKYYRGIMGG